MRRSLAVAAFVLSAASFAHAQTDAQPATQPAAPTGTLESTTPGSFNRQSIQQGLAPEQYFATAQELAAQAAVAYPVPFIDKPLWNDAVKNAEAASAATPDNAEYQRYLGQLYTTVQWWYQGYLTWRDLATKGELSAEDRNLAALCAARVGFIRLERGLPQEAVPFFQESLQYQDNPEVRRLLTRAQGG